MKTLQELYREILEQEQEKGRDLTGEYDNYPMDCLLHPEKYAPVVAKGSCDSCGGESSQLKRYRGKFTLIHKNVRDAEPVWTSAKWGV